MLEATSDQGTFTVEMTWTPADIGSENTFEIRFIEPETGKEVEDMVYDFGMERDGVPLFMRMDQDARVQKVAFGEPGPYTVVVDNIDGLGEGASFTVQVTPEFPIGWALPAAFVALFALRNKLVR